MYYRTQRKSADCAGLVERIMQIKRITYSYRNYGIFINYWWKMKYKQIAYAYADLNEVELAQVLQAFSQWALEQEEAE